MKNTKFINGVNRYELTNIDEFYSGRKEYTDYKRIFDLSSKMCFTADMPMYVNIETNNYCNMKCKMCIKSFKESATGNENLSMRLLEKILKESHDLVVPSFFLGGGLSALLTLK